MNMSYCRFTNTLRDLIDCKENMGNKLSDLEAIARRDLVELCKYIAREYDEEGLLEGKNEDV